MPTVCWNDLLCAALGRCGGNLLRSTDNGLLKPTGASRKVTVLDGRGAHVAADLRGYGILGGFQLRRSDRVDLRG